MAVGGGEDGVVIDRERIERTQRGQPAQLYWYRMALPSSRVAPGRTWSGTTMPDRRRVGQQQAAINRAGSRSIDKEGWMAATQQVTGQPRDDRGGGGGTRLYEHEDQRRKERPGGRTPGWAVGGVARAGVEIEIISLSLSPPPSSRSNGNPTALVLRANQHTFGRRDGLWV